MATISSEPSVGALELRGPQLDRKPALTARKRTLTKRGVLWLGQTCNLRCYFCYFLERIEDAQHPEHPFMDLEKAKAICKRMRYFYGNTSVDIQGGEPTIHPDIFELIRYCDEIGLYPTLITNGIVLGKPGMLEKYQDAGIRDFLVSLHGLGAVHDEVVGRKGAADKIIAAIERMVELHVPFRFNCTMSKPVVQHLPEIARKAVEYGAGAVNFIAFNPFGDQEAGQRTRENVERYSTIKVTLTQAMDILDEAGIECNVRYLPLCMGEERHRKNFYNFQQLPYDHHEWDYQTWLWTMMQPQMMKQGPLVPPLRMGAGMRHVYEGRSHRARDLYEAHPVVGSIAVAGQRILGRAQQLVQGKSKMFRQEAIIRADQDCKYKYSDACSQCSVKAICDGFHGDYAEFFGTGEAEPITEPKPVDDPLFYIRNQDKIVEHEDRAWAL